MKKVMVFLAIAMVAGMTKAAQVDWTFTATADQVGMAVYVLSAIPDSITSSGDITGKALANQTIEGKKVGRTTQYFAEGSTSYQSDGEQKFYYALIDAKGENYWISDAQTGLAYTPPATGSSASLNASGLLADGWKGFSGGSDDPVTPPGPGGVPEPTSGVLLLVGGSLLALRRKQK